MTGHEVLVKRDYTRGGWYARCVEYGCSWQVQGIVGQRQAEARAQGHETAMRRMEARR